MPSERIDGASCDVNGFVLRGTELPLSDVPNPVTFKCLNSTQKIVSSNNPFLLELENHLTDC